MGNISVPKVLVMLKNKPLILYLLEEIEKINQLAKPILVVGYMHEQVEAILGDGYLYALQEPQLGTAHAVMAAKDQIQAENILVLYGDMPLIKAESLKRLITLHHKNQANLSMFTAKVPNFENEFVSLGHFGRIIRNSFLSSNQKGMGEIIKITEFKDASESERQIKEVNPGIYMFNTKWLWENITEIKNKNVQNEYYLTDIVEIAINQKEPIHSLEINPREVLGINNLEELKLVEKMLV